MRRDQQNKNLAMSIFDHFASMNKKVEDFHPITLIIDYLIEEIKEGKYRHQNYASQIL